MRNFRFEDAEVIVLDSMPASRDITKNSLYDIGFRRFQLTDNFDEAREMIGGGSASLMITDAFLANSSSAQLILDIRNGKVGPDPFLPIIALTWEPTVEIVHSIVNAGTDLMLTLPLSTGKLLSAIETVIERRKPFVVTSAYFGPDRRTAARIEGDSVPLIEAPNSLRRKTTNDKSGPSLEAALELVKDQRVERHVAKITFTIGQISGLGGGDTPGTLKDWLWQLHEVVVDLDERISESRYGHLSGICKSLLDVSDGIATSGSPSAADLEILQQLALAIEVGIARDDTASVEAALDITAMVRKGTAAG